MTAFTDPVEYTVKLTHYHDGEVITEVLGVGDSLADRAAVAYALREAIRQLEDEACTAVSLKGMS